MIGRYLDNVHAQNSLYLDHIGEISMHISWKLLRAIIQLCSLSWYRFSDVSTVIAIDTQVLHDAVKIFKVDIKYHNFITLGHEWRMFQWEKK